MGLTLPYVFDTSRIVRLILRGVVGFELVVVVPGIVYSIVAGRGLLPVAMLAVSGVFFLAFGWIVIGVLEAASGTITSDSVVVEPMRFCGIRAPGFAGTLPITQFAGVRVVRVSGRIDTTPPTGDSTRVYLVGRNGTANLLIARAGVGEGTALANDLGAALELPCEESSAPY